MVSNPSNSKEACQAKKGVVAFVQYTSPAVYPPIMNAAQSLHSSGYEVRLWGVQAFGDAQGMKMPTKDGMHLWLMRGCRPGVRQKIHYARFVFMCVVCSLWYRPKVIYCSDLWSYPIGWVLYRMLGFTVIAHEHDTPAVGGRIATGVCFAARRRLFPHVPVVFPQKQRAEKVSREIGVGSYFIVWNCPRRDEICGRGLPDGDEVVLWYHGSIVPSQFPKVIVDAIAILPGNYSLKFAGYETIGNRGYISDFLDYAQSRGVAKRVKYVGTIPTRTELFEWASKCDIGLALFDREFREPMVGASNKPFDYLACGLGVLANGTEEWKSFFRDVPSVIHCDPSDAESIARVLLEIHSDRKLFADARAFGTTRMLSDWYYEKQFEKVLDEIESAPDTRALV
ncbi:MAG: hypothetical protein ACK5O8_13045 [Pirellula sp.]|jgi:glycosyltransferase involved in cell wall biosynthesis